MNESEVAGMAAATAVPIPADEALTGSSAEALQGVNAGALPGAVPMNVTAQPVPMDTTATSLKTPVTVCETLMAAMMNMITESETLMANDARRLGELIAQRHAISEQLTQRKQELLEAQRQLECTRQQIARSSEGAGC